jgi:DNA modification methylase
MDQINEIQNLDAGYLTVIPVSVIDVAAQGKRKNEDHNSTSSRANYSPFPVEIATLCAEFFLRDATTVFDPFAGWGERGAAVIKTGKKYIGYDLSPDAIAKAAEMGVANTLCDSRTAVIPAFDGFFTCPPYWNLETYASAAGIDRIKEWGLFLDALFDVFSRSYAAAISGATFCVMVGDWRKQHKYYPLEWEVCDMFDQLGAAIVDKIVVSRSKVSKIKIMLPQAKRLGYSVRVHENLLVFKKP